MSSPAPEVATPRGARVLRGRRRPHSPNRPEHRRSWRPRRDTPCISVPSSCCHGSCVALALAVPSPPSGRSPQPCAHGSRLPRPAPPAGRLPRLAGSRWPGTPGYHNGSFYVRSPDDVFRLYVMGRVHVDYYAGLRSRAERARPRRCAGARLRAPARAPRARGRVLPAVAVADRRGVRAFGGEQRRGQHRRALLQGQRDDVGPHLQPGREHRRRAERRARRRRTSS